MTLKSHFLVGAEEDSSLLLYCSLSARLVEPFLGLSPLGHFSGKALGPRSLFFLFFGNYGALCENKGIWILFRKNVTYKQIALENLGLTLSAWVRRRESPTLAAF